MIVYIHLAKIIPLIANQLHNTQVENSYPEILKFGFFPLKHIEQYNL